MALDRIEILLENYFQGKSSIADEKELTNYFLSENVAQHLVQYKPLFGYFSQSKKQVFQQEIPLQTKKRNVAWLSIAASVVILIGVGTFIFYNNSEPKKSQDLGTFDNPEMAYQQTQKALELLSQNVNVGIESVSYINEYQNSKNLIFKQ